MVVPVGDAVRVTLQFRGENLKKPIYFVREGGAFKLNIAPPGFWRALPEDALFATHSYSVHNVNIQPNEPFTLLCFRGQNTPDGRVTVAPQKTGKVSCADNCGKWFSGTTFQAASGGTQKKCDWNWWGDDVVINLLDPDGWRCNDPC